MKTPVTRLDCGQYLLISQTNYMLTHFANHCKRFSHDAINSFLHGERIAPRLMWKNMRTQMDTGYATKALLLFIESLQNLLLLI
jgi:hypothetical protein